MLFSSLHFVFTPLVRAGDVSQGDFLRLLAYGVLLVGVWRAIRNSEFGRAVAEERARVAREIHDGLAQYLFAVSTHAVDARGRRRPERDDSPAQGGCAARPAGGALRDPRALVGIGARAVRRRASPLRRRPDRGRRARGRARRSTPSITLGPDEQIEVFRIVQEGLANARKHAGAPARSRRDRRAARRALRAR